MGEAGIYARICRELEALGIDAGSDLRNRQLETFVREVALWSGRIHLVGKRRIRQTLVRLFVDSWLMYLFARDWGILGTAREGLRIADVGSGAGFPGLVWKIIDPELEVTLLERREKPLRFLDRTIALLGLDGVRVVGGEAKDTAEEGSFDIVVSKAAGRIGRLSGLVSRLLAAGGFYVTVKGSGWRREIDGDEKGALRLESHRELPEGRGVVVLFSVRGRNAASAPPEYH